MSAVAAVTVALTHDTARLQAMVAECLRDDVAAMAAVVELVDLVLEMLRVLAVPAGVTPGDVWRALLLVRAERACRSP